MIFFTSFNTPSRRLPVLHLSMAVAIGLLSCLVARISAQTTTPPSAQTTALQTTANPPLMDNKVFVHALSISSKDAPMDRIASFAGMARSGRYGYE
jgi:hypothetical protein